MSATDQATDQTAADQTAAAAERERWTTDLVGLALAAGFLSRAFYEEPSWELLRPLFDDGVLETWPLEGEDPDVRAGLTLLQGLVEQWDPAQLARLRRDHTRLFLGPGIKAAPWESVYLGADHLLFEQQTLAVRAFYDQFGLQAPNIARDPDDHLGLELAFVVHLCTLALQALEAGDDERFTWRVGALRSFLRIHLLRWAPRCLALVLEHAETDFYRAVALLARGTLTLAAARLGVAPASQGPHAS